MVQAFMGNCYLLNSIYSILRISAGSELQSVGYASLNTINVIGYTR